MTTTLSTSTPCLLKAAKMALACSLPPVPSNINSIFEEKKIRRFGITPSLIILYLANNCGRRNQHFYCYLETSRWNLCLLYTASLSLSLVFRFFTASFQHSCLLFIMKATVESFRFACSCGYPASHKHGNFLPRFPLLNQVEAWHPSQLWPLNALMLQLCLFLLTTRSSERAFLLLRPEQPPLLSASSEPASILPRVAEQ